MSVSDKIKNRGAHGDSSLMLGGVPSSNENPPDLSEGSVNVNNKRCGSCAHWNKETRKCRNKDAFLYGSIRDEFDYCPSFCPRLTTRDDIVGAWQDMDHLLSVMNGMGGEITDREAFAAVTKAVWLVLDCTVRGIDKTEDKNG